MSGAEVIEEWVIELPELGPAEYIESLVYKRCMLKDWKLPTFGTTERNLVRNVQLDNCTLDGDLDFGNAILQDVHIDTLSGGVIRADGAVFDRVTLKGEIDAACFPNGAENYGGVDWALDITDARFGECPDLSGVPGRLIVRNPETQVLVRRAELEASDWQSIEFGATKWAQAIEKMIADKREGEVLVVPMFSVERWAYMDVVDQLRELGVIDDAQPEKTLPLLPSDALSARVAELADSFASWVGIEAFSTDQMMALDELIDKRWPNGVPEERLEYWADLVGAYIGEVAIREMDCRWVWDPDEKQPALEFEDVVVYPVSKARMRASVGREHAIAPFYKAMQQLSADQASA